MLIMWENEKMTALGLTGVPRANVEACIIIVKVRGFSFLFNGRELTCFLLCFVFFILRSVLSLLPPAPLQSESPVGVALLQLL